MLVGWWGSASKKTFVAPAVSAALLTSTVTDARVCRGPGGGPDWRQGRARTMPATIDVEPAMETGVPSGVS